MRYTLIFKDKKVWYTDWYDYENHWNDYFHFVVINNISCQFSENGKDWKDIEEDSL